MSIRSKVRKHFDALGQPWRNCWAEMGRMYPQSEMTEYNGKWYCQEHARTKIHKDTMNLPVEIQDEVNDRDTVGSDYTAVIPDTFGNTDRS